MDTVARTKGEFRAVSKLTSSIVWLSGLGTVAFVGHKLISSGASELVIQDIHAILLAPTLTLLFIPIACLFHLVAAYETLFLRVNFGLGRDRRLIRYARWRLLRTLGLNLVRVHAFTRTYATDLFAVKSRADLDSLIMLSEIPSNE